MAVFDEKALMERVDNDLEFLQETIEILDEDSPDLLSQIRTAASARDADALVSPAHALKGMLSNFCAEPAVSAARALEEMGRKQELVNIDDAVDDVEHETTQLAEALHAFLEAQS